MSPRMTIQMRAADSGCACRAPGWEGRAGSAVDWVGQHPQVTPAAASARWAGENGIHRTVYPAGLPYRLGQSGQVIHRRLQLGELTVMPHNVPAPWSGQAQCMPLTQIVGMRLAAGGQRAHHSSGV